MRLLVAAMMLVVSLAGCADGDGTASDDCPEGQEMVDGTCFEKVQATADTGVIRGVVVDEAIRPMVGVPVTATMGDVVTEATTNEEGLFAFGELEPGFYEVATEKPGYEPTTLQAEVVAGEDQPPIVRIQLTPIPGYNPFSELIQWNGYLQCNSTYVNACLIINYYPQALLGADPVLDDTSIKVWWDEFVGKEQNPDWVQAETHWKPSQLLGSSLSIRYEVGSPDSTTVPCVFASREGESPMVYAINRSMAEDAGLGAPDPAPDDEGCDEEQAWGLAMEFFSGDALGLCQPTLIGCHPRVGVTVGQDTETFINHFYGYTPPEGWTFAENGEFPPPS